MESVEGWKAGNTGYLVVLLPPHKDTEGAKRTGVAKRYSPGIFLIISYLETS